MSVRLTINLSVSEKHLADEIVEVGCNLSVEAKASANTRIGGNALSIKAGRPADVEKREDELAVDGIGVAYGIHDRDWGKISLANDWRVGFV